MNIKLSINIKINPWKAIVLVQLGFKAIKLIRALHHARTIGKKTLNIELIAAFDDL